MTKRYAEARKRGQRLLAPMERWLLTQTDDRHDESVLHVSDLTKNEWCPRMLYYRITGVRPKLESRSFQLQNILDYGSDAHDKFQTRWWDMGVLWGKWFCHDCRSEFLAKSPTACPQCGIAKYALRYREVPLAAPELRMVGNADGEIRDAQGGVLVEIKTVAEGTFRVETPKLLGEYTHEITWDDGRTGKLVDIAELWKNLARPIPTHSRQGQTYAELRKRYTNEPPVDAVVFWYEHKGNQGLKEFVVKPDPTVAAEVLGRAKDVVFALERDAPPRCREGRGGCKLCIPYEEEARRAHSTAQTAAGAAVRPRRQLRSGGRVL